MAASFAPAVRADDWEACQNANPDVRIFGCSAVIDAGTDTKKNIALAYSNRGLAYGDKGEYDRAITDYDKAIALNPEDAVAYYNRGVAYEELGNKQQAATDYQKALSLRPGDKYVTVGLQRLKAAPRKSQSCQPKGP